MDNIDYYFFRRKECRLQRYRNLEQGRRNVASKSIYKLKENCSQDEARCEHCIQKSEK
jgi:hypothetical protein